MATAWPSTGPTTVSAIEPSGSRCSTPPAIEHPSFASPDSCTVSAAEPSSPEQVMIPQQAMMNDALSPHTPSPLPADADATVTGTDIVYLAGLQRQPVEWRCQHRLAAGTLAMLSGGPGSGKTWVALAIAAALTRGRKRQPRFAGLHGDPARLVILRRAVSVRSMSSPNSALRDLEELQRRKIRPLVVDFAASGELVPSAQQGKMLKLIV
jgi:hypothetical protein